MTLRKIDTQRCITANHDAIRCLTVTRSAAPPALAARAALSVSVARASL